MLFSVQMMSHLMAVKDKQTIADNMFEPLKATIELLKTYGQELSDDVHLQVQVSTLHSQESWPIKIRPGTYCMGA